MPPMPIKLGDKTWPSRRAAAQDLGCSPATLESYLDRGIEHLLLEGKRKPKPGRAFTIDGATYISASAAGRALGLSHTTILRKHGAAK